MPKGFGFYNEEIPVIKENLELKKENIERIIFTNKGSRINKPNFGTSILTYLFNFENVIKEDLVDNLTYNIQRFQPDIKVLDINIKKKIDYTFDVNIVLQDLETEEEIKIFRNLEVE